MPAESPSIHDEWWIVRQFKEAELKSKSARLQQQREGAEAIRSLIAELGLTDEDLQEMFPPAEPSTDR
jgi:hypothetical protein